MYDISHPCIEQCCGLFTHTWMIFFPILPFSLAFLASLLPCSRIEYDVHATHIIPDTLSWKSSLIIFLCYSEACGFSFL